jgi:hypothetical protein
MKVFFVIVFLNLCLSSFSQKPKSGTYTYKYCDTEYRNCISTCRIIIKGDSIKIYATKALSERITLTKENELIEEGIIMKHKSGKWIIGKSKSDEDAEGIGGEGPSIIDFTNKEYWTF